MTAMEVLGRLRDFPGFDQWTATRFELDADGPLPTGVDGEFVAVQPPVVFTIRPRALRVRLPPNAPGASPAARAVRIDWATLGALWNVARYGDAGHKGRAERYHANDDT